MENITNRYLADLVLSYELLEKIATLRFICMHISNWIIECFDLLKTGSDTQISDHILREKKRMIISFQDICLMDGFEYLHVLLLKNIYHQLGSDTLHLITENRDCSWIIPEHVMKEMAEVWVVENCESLYLHCLLYCHDLVTCCNAWLLHNLRRGLHTDYKCSRTSELVTE